MNLTSLTATIDDLKTKLPIPFVLDHYGHKPASETSGRLHYRNPWRSDDKPSLDVFTDEHGVQRAGDFAEGFNGSVLDIIGRQIGTEEVPRILAEARDLYRIYLEDGWDGPEFVGLDHHHKVMDPELVERVMAANRATRQNGVVVDLLSANPGIDADVLDRFGVRSYGERIALPYPDGAAIRFRSIDSKTFLAGSKPGLYHALDQDLATESRVLLVEGESDTWAALPHWDGIVVGIPGVGHQPAKWMDAFEGKTVTIAFDGDVAGRSAATRWATALSSAGCDVQIVPIPDDRDVANLPPAEFDRLLGLTRSLVRNNTGMVALQGGYFIEGRKEGDFKAVSNWTVEPRRILDFEDDVPRAFEVEVRVDGDLVPGDARLLTFEDMSSSRRLHRWAAQFSGAWWGGTTDHQKLRAVIEEQAAFLPVDSATSKPSLVNGTFVYPGGSVGEMTTVCVPDPSFPLSDPAIYSLEPGHARPRRTIQRLLNMHESGVMQPLLAWLAVAPLRSRFRQFPPLFVTGRAGSGKTTLVQEAVGTFSGVRFVTNLTSTTPYALTLTMGGTNFVVTWFDEYRPGARRNTMDMMDQLLRDAYNGAPSRRGGMGEDKTKVTQIETSNPLLVSGEDFADEQSHRDRLIKVFVPRDGKGSLPVWDEQDEAFAADYLDWLTTRADEGLSPSPVDRAPALDSSGYLSQGVTERQAHNLAVLDYGWRLLRDYLFERDSYALGDPDWSHLVEVSQDEASSDPVSEALRQHHESTGNTRGMWYSEPDDTYYINSGTVLRELLRDPTTSVPFTSAKAMTQYLVQDLGGVSVRKSGPLTLGEQVRYVALANPWPTE